MDNQTAFWLGLALLAAAAADGYALDWGVTQFLGRQFLGLLDWVAFWR